MAVNRISTDANAIDYDSENDSLFFFIKGAEYSHSLNMNNIILDFNTDQSLKGVEILNASKKFGVPKHALRNPNQMVLDLDVSEEKIDLKISLVLRIRNKPTPKAINIEDINEFNIPAGTMTMSCGVC
ncbi:Protein of unknown function DUF2283 [Methanolacinia petrolearia DSM 11571]|uniref:DUF2283 domain-containing protein n=1 Tax=Methanolacinia petrolearia (strain DSM 11571 / OCM 486 / SEBR 4847) TaxID=679926 RepID=E1RD95_METP4|nr:DUF2283 domain-containing protein [Methanolacinia petrolearia]ADN37078.1 Protein of unknown function DUF2283 [Methanolacinia petrolearia DSM 11571]